MEEQSENEVVFKFKYLLKLALSFSFFLCVNLLFRASTGLFMQVMANAALK